jgi:hypothetical protein
MSENSETPSGLTKALNLGPRTKVHLTLGTLYGAAGALLSAAFFIWNLSAKVDGVAAKLDATSADIVAIREDLKPVLKQTAILWDEHMRTASNWKKP